jgi:hypothetical protein
MTAYTALEAAAASEIGADSKEPACDAPPRTSGLRDADHPEIDGIADL